MLAEEIRDYIEESRKYVWVCMGLDFDYARNDVKRLANGKLSPKIVEELTAIVDGVNDTLETKYDVYNECETAGNSRTVCSHYDLDKREYMSDPTRPKPYQPRGAIDGMGIDAELAANLQLNARWGSSCGRAWYADEFLKEHPQFDHLRPFLHDRPSQPWTILPEIR